MGDVRKTGKIAAIARALMFDIQQPANVFIARLYADENQIEIIKRALEDLAHESKIDLRICHDSRYSFSFINHTGHKIELSY